jgi:hypothetical protein
MFYRDRPLDLRPTGGATGTGSWNLGLQEELQGQASGSEAFRRRYTDRSLDLRPAKELQGRASGP